MISHIRSNRIVRYLFGGGIAAVVNLALLTLFVEAFHMWYVSGAALAMTFSLILSFVIQKFFVFENGICEDDTRQVGWFFAISLFNIGLNALLIWIFVDILGAHYLIGQILSAALIAIESYFAYKYLVFKEATHTLTHVS